MSVDYTLEIEIGRLIYPNFSSYLSHQVRGGEIRSSVYS